MTDPTRMDPSEPMEAAAPEPAPAPAAAPVAPPAASTAPAAPTVSAAAPAPAAPPSAAAAAIAARPTGITILAALSGIGGVLSLFSGFVVLGVGATVFGGMGALLGLAILALAGLSIALAWGFWTMQPWAWPLGVVLEGFSILLAVVQFFGANTSIVSTIISVGIAGAILYYLNQPTIKSLFGRA